MPAPRAVLCSPLQNVWTPPVRAGESARSGQPAERQTGRTAGAQPASATGQTASSSQELAEHISPSWFIIEDWLSDWGCSQWECYCPVWLKNHCEGGDILFSLLFASHQWERTGIWSILHALSTSWWKINLLQTINPRQLSWNSCIYLVKLIL